VWASPHSPYEVRGRAARREYNKALLPLGAKKAGIQNTLIKKNI